MASLISLAPVFAARPLGIDVAQFQGDINWNQVYAGGRVFAFVRATHGSDQDSRFHDNMINAKAAGVLAGPYHFAVPVYDAAYNIPGASPEIEAARFLNMARNYIVPGYLRPVLDIELGGGKTPVGASNLGAWCHAWIEEVERQTGVEAIVYCNSNYAKNYLSGANPSLNTRTLWIANWSYPSDPDTAYPPNGTGIWSTWQFWQYSNMGNTSGHPSVPGVPTRVDLNVFNGTYSQLQQHVIGRNAIIATEPGSLSQLVRQGYNAASQSFTVRNIGTGGLVYRAVPNRTWLSVSPASNFVKHGTNTLTVTYSTESLMAGTHTASIELIGDLAGNSPYNFTVTLTVTPMKGDLDGNSSIDGVDVSMFAGCLGGANQPITAGCEAADLDSDQDVDQSDFALLQACISGTGIPADPFCIP